ncbi:hypothetical protein SKAU_G00038080 [Synaphobranchus kaupii]|uniref:Uncharacterized protein n=1 Tax=Synaphobranchus kaupii TaxID=118154 RepID=A0A9Q1GF58_SYNKA|nr:hypothetical protein SKAU_G00038080 [Synaphobranchus kaupii]
MLKTRATIRCRSKTGEFYPEETEGTKRQRRVASLPKRHRGMPLCDQSPSPGILTLPERPANTLTLLRITAREEDVACSGRSELGAQRLLYSARRGRHVTLRNSEAQIERYRWPEQDRRYERERAHTTALNRSFIPAAENESTGGKKQ